MGGPPTITLGGCAGGGGFSITKLPAVSRREMKVSAHALDKSEIFHYFIYAVGHIIQLHTSSFSSCLWQLYCKISLGQSCYRHFYTIYLLHKAYLWVTNVSMTVCHAMHYGWNKTLHRREKTADETATFLYFLNVKMETKTWSKEERRVATEKLKDTTLIVLKMHGGQFPLFWWINGRKRNMWGQL